MRTAACIAIHAINLLLPQSHSVFQHDEHFYRLTVMICSICVYKSTYFTAQFIHTSIRTNKQIYEKYMCRQLRLYEVR